MQFLMRYSSSLSPQQPKEIACTLQGNTHLAQHIVLDGSGHDALHPRCHHVRAAVLTQFCHGEEEVARLLLHSCVR